MNRRSFLRGLVQAAGFTIAASYSKLGSIAEVKPVEEPKPVHTFGYFDAPPTLQYWKRGEPIPICDRDRELGTHRLTTEPKYLDAEYDRRQAAYDEAQRRGERPDNPHLDDEAYKKAIANLDSKLRTRLLRGRWG